MSVPAVFGSSIPNYNRINEWPLQFLRTGFYNRSFGNLVNRTADGYWWSDTASSATGGRNLDARTGYVLAQYSSFRGYGFALRCVAPNVHFLVFYTLPFLR